MLSRFACASSDFFQTSSALRVAIAAVILLLSTLALGFAGQTGETAEETGPAKLPVAADPKSPEEIAKALEGLSSEDFKRRESSTARLVAAGEAAVPALRAAAAASKDVEVTARIAHVLKVVADADDPEYREAIGPIVAAGVRWLALHQESDGCWDPEKYGGKAEQTQITALALLAFLSCGHTESAGKYKDSVQRAVRWLISKQDANGKIGRDNVTHAIAGMALADAACAARIPSTVAAAQRAADLSLAIQSAGSGGKKAGWRKDGTAKDDLETSGWFIRQIKSAKVAGLQVATEGFEGAIGFLDSVKRTEGETAFLHGWTVGEQPSPGATAVGVLCREMLGWRKEEVQKTVGWFVDKGGLPDWQGGSGFDAVYWYFGGAAAYEIGGEVWFRWKQALRSCLQANQWKHGDEGGSWDPVGAKGRDWGRVGSTAIGCLCLAVSYRAPICRKLPVVRPAPDGK